MGNTIRLHALVREAAISRLARRDWSRFVDLTESAQRFFLDELTRAPDTEGRVRVLYRFLGLGRHHPALRGDYYAPSDLGPECSVRTATSVELCHFLDVVRRHEGPPSMEIVRRWLAHPGTRLSSVRANEDRPAGFLMTLRVSLRDRHPAIGADPLVATLVDFVKRTEESRPDDEIIVNRTLVDREQYQTPSSVLRHIHAAMADAMLWHSPAPAHAFTVYTEPDLWEPVAIAAGFARLRAQEVAIGGRTFAPFHRSARGVTAATWFTEIGRRMVAAMRAVAQPSSANA